MSDVTAKSAAAAAAVDPIQNSCIDVGFGKVAAWLIQEGWINALNMAGGIDAYARQVEPSIGLY